MPKFNVSVSFECSSEFDIDTVEDLDEEQRAEIKDFTPDELKDWLCGQLEDDPNFFGNVDIGSIIELTLTPKK